MTSSSRGAGTSSRFSDTGSRSRGFIQSSAARSSSTTGHAIVNSGDRRVYRTRHDSERQLGPILYRIPELIQAREKQEAAGARRESRAAAACP